MAKGPESIHAGHRERLRARYAQSGLAGFADHEALELLLTFAIPRGDTNAIGHALLKRFGSLEGVFSAHTGELAGVPGVGERSALLIKLCGDLFLRLSIQNLSEGTALRLCNAEDAARYALRLLRGERYECAYVIGLDKNRTVLQATRLAVGTLTETPIYPRRVVETALLQRAHAVMLLHNHPSGDPRPSQADCDMTQAVQAALRSIDIQLYDHLIAGRQAVYSFTRGLILAFGGDGMHAVPPQEFRLPFAHVETAPPQARSRAAEEEG